MNLDEVRADVTSDLVEQGFPVADVEAAVLRSSTPVFSAVYTAALEWLREKKREVLALLRIAHPVRRPVPLLTVLRDPVVAPRRAHAPASLVLKSGVSER